MVCRPDNSTNIDTPNQNISEQPPCIAWLQLLTTIFSPVSNGVTHRSANCRAFNDVERPQAFSLIVISPDVAWWISILLPPTITSEANREFFMLLRVQLLLSATARLHYVLKLLTCPMACVNIILP